MDGRQRGPPVGYLRVKADARPRWFVPLAAVCFLTWAVFGSLVSTSGLVEVIRADLGLSYSQGGFLLSVPFPLITLFALTGGIFVDRLGVAKMARLGATLVLAGGLIRVWSTGLWPLAAGIALVGAGAGVIFPILPKVARETAPPERREAAAAFYTAAVVTGAAMGVALSGYLAAFLGEVPFARGGAGWRGGYLAWAFALLLTFILWERACGRTMAVNPVAPGTRDEPGARDEPEARGGGPGAGAAFSVWRSRPVWAVTAALFLNNVIFYTGIGWFPTILRTKGWPLAQAGLIVSLLAWLGVVAVLTAHKIAPAVGGVARFTVICTLATAAALVALTLPGGWTAAWAVILIGFALSFWFVLCMGYPARAVPAESAGQAGGMIIGLGYFGWFLGPWAAGIIRDAVGDFAPVLYILAAATILSLVTAPSLGRRAG